MAVALGFWIVRARYRKTLLGWVWLPLRPGIDIFGKTLLFGAMLGVSSGDRPYLIFYLIGQAAWQFFDRSAFWAMRSLEMSRRTLQHIAIPRLVAVISAVIPASVEFLIYVCFAFAITLFYVVERSTFFIALDLTTGISAVGLVLLGLFGITWGLFTSVPSLHVRDIRFVSGFLFSLVYVMTPVIYPISSIPRPYSLVAQYNPLTAPIEMVKYGLLRTAPPTTASIVVSVSTLSVLLALGLCLFARSDARLIARV